MSSNQTVAGFLARGVDVQKRQIHVLHPTSDTADRGRAYESMRIIGSQNAEAVQSGIDIKLLIWLQL